MMNYIELINRFWKCNIEHPLTASDTRLYFYLLHTCNQLGWKIPFGHSDRYLAALTGLSVPTVRNGKKRLQERGLIIFKAPKIKSKAFEGQSKYWFPTVQNFCTDSYTDIDTVSCTGSFTDSNTVPLTNNKLNKTKQENIINPYNPLNEKKDFLKPDFKGQESLKEAQGNSLALPGTENSKKRRKVAPKEEKDQDATLPFTSDQFAECWEMLMQMPKWKDKQSQSLQLTLKKLSKYDEEFAIQLVEVAITNDWQGIIYPDTDTKYKEWKKNKLQNGNEKINLATGIIKSCSVETEQPERNYKERL